MKKLSKNLFVLIVLFIVGQHAFAQIKPIQTTVVLNPPHPIFLSDYSTIGSDALQAIINFNDLSESSWQIRLRVTIESEDIKIQTSPNFIPTLPIEIQVGVPLVLQGVDFYNYLSLDNVLLEGITATALSRTGKLPEGFYTFTVEVLDFNSGAPLAHAGFASAFLTMEPPPVLLSPLCEEVIIPTSPQNIFFQWQIAGGINPSISMNSLYQLGVYEVTEDGADPYYAVQNNQAILVYESDFVNQISTALDFNTVLLTAGNKYVFRVRAVDEDGKDVYSNNGFSEWCWFYYGYPTGGKIELGFPADEHLFGKKDVVNFNWSGSDKGLDGQQYEYEIVIKEINEDQTKEDAIKNNIEWFVGNSPSTTSSTGSNFILNENIGRDKHYAWQVYAKTGTQTVAKSNISTFYAPPLVDEFYAGTKKIKVVSLTSNVLTDLSGVARIPLSSNPSDYVDVEFEHISVVERFGKSYMFSGEIIFNMSEKEANLTPVFSENGGGKFEYTQGKLTTSGLKVKGKIKWALPHATASGDVAYVTTVEGWFYVDSEDKISGQAKLALNNDFELIDPLGFVLKLDPQSDIQLSKNEFTLRIKGTIGLQKNIQTSDGKQYFIPFRQQEQLFYFEGDNLLNASTNYIRPSKEINVNFKPKTAVIDLSEKESPGKLSGDKYWKGAYFPEFVTVLKKDNFDKSKQLKIPYDYEYHDDLGDDFKFWVTAAGLQMDYMIKYDQEGTQFNTFATKFEADFIIENGEIQEGKFYGDVKIPFIDKNTDFAYTIPITQAGLALGRLTEDLTQREVVFNPFGGENKVNLDLTKAVFVDNDRLKLSITGAIPALGVTNMKITDFRVYGDNNIGVGSKGGAKTLAKKVTGRYDDRGVTVNKVGAAFINDNYAFSYEATIDLGAGIVGNNGAPVIAISSVQPSGTTGGGSSPSIAIPSEAVGKRKITSTEMEVHIKDALVDIKGTLQLTQNDPRWGRSFRGNLKGSVKAPTELEGAYAMVLGKKDGVDFWYFDTYFNDKEGVGVNVYTDINMVAMEGRVYSHMSISNGGEFKVDRNTKLGANMFLQLIDQSTGGMKFVADLSAQTKVTNDNFEIIMEGKVSVLNQEHRSGVAGGVVKIVAETVANEIIKHVMPQSIDIAGGTLTVDAQDIKSGSLAYSKGDVTVKLAGDMNDAPMVELDLSKGGDKIHVKGSADGVYALDLAIDGKAFGLGVEGGNSGYFNMKYDDISIKTEGNKEDKTGSLYFKRKEIELDVAVQTDKAHLNLQYDNDNLFKSGFDKAGSAYLEYKHKNNEYALSGDKNAQTGSFKIKMEGLEMFTDVDAMAKSAHFFYETPAEKIDIKSINAKEGTLLIAKDEELINISTNLEDFTGSISLKNGSDKELNGALLKSGEGYLQLVNGDQKFGISGNTDGSSGGVTFEDGSVDFLIEANKTDGSGRLELKYEGSEVDAIINKDSASALLVNGDAELEAGMSSTGMGKVRLKHEGVEIAITGNPTTKAGSLYLSDGDKLLNVAGDPVKKTGMIDFAYDGNSVKGAFTPEHANLELKTADFEFSADGDVEGNGFVAMKEGDKEMRLAVDRNQHAGEIFIKNANESIQIKGNESETYALVDIQQADVNLFAELNKDAVQFKSGPITLNGKANGTGQASYAKDGDLIQLSKTDEAIALAIQVESSDIKLNHNISSTENTVIYKDETIGVTANQLNDEGSIAIKHSEFEMLLTGNMMADGTLNFKNSDFEIGVAGNAIRKNGEISFKHKDIVIVGAGDPKAKAGKIDFKQNNTQYYAEYSATKKAIIYNDGEVMLNGGYDRTNFNIGFGYQNHKVDLSTQGTAKELKYEGIAVLTIKENATQLSHAGVTVKYAQGNVNYNNKAVYGNGAPIKKGDWSQQETINGALTKMSVKDNAFKMVFIQDNDSIVFTSSTINDGTINVYDNDKLITASKIGGRYAIEHNDYLVALENSSVEIKKGTAYRLAISETNAELNYENYNFTASADLSLTFTDGVHQAAVSPSGLSVSKGVHQLKITADKTLFAQYKDNQNIAISTTGIEVNYEDKNLKLQETEVQYSDNDRLYKVTPQKIEIKEGQKEVELSKEKLYLAVDANKSLVLTQNKLAVSYADKTIKVSTNNSLSYKDNNYDFAISEAEGLSLALDDKSVNLKPGSLAIGYSTDKSISITPVEMKMNYDGRLVKLGEKALYFTDGNQTIDLSGERLALSKGVQNVFVTKDKFGLTIAQDKVVEIKADELSFQYDNIVTSFSASKALSFTDGVRSFELGTSGLTMDDGLGHAIGVVSYEGKQAIELINNEDRFFINKDGFEVDYDGTRYEVNKNTQLVVKIDATKRLEVTIKEAKFIENEIELILGGPNNFLELKDKVRSIALTQEPALLYSEDIYTAKLYPTKTIELSDGIRTIGINRPDHILTYEQGKYLAGIRHKEAEIPGIDFIKGGLTTFIEGVKNESVGVGVSSDDFGKLALSCTADKVLSADYTKGSREITLEVSEEHILFYDSDLLPKPTNTPDVEGKKMDEPIYLENSIADDASGRIKGAFRMSYVSKTNTFSGSGAIKGSKPGPCISNGNLGFVFSPKKVELNVGSKNNPINIKPICSAGLSGNGWLQISKSSVTIGIASGWRNTSAQLIIGDDIDKGDAPTGAKLKASCSFNMDTELGLSLSTLLVEKASIAFKAGASISGGIKVLGFGESLNLGTVSMSGNLSIEQGSSLTMKGTLRGKISIAEVVEANKSFSFSKTF
jgi:hypothetical protein